MTGLDPLAWTRAYGYLYPTEVFSNALAGACGPVGNTLWQVCCSEHRRLQAAWLTHHDYSRGVTLGA